jgi:hypothetical protein
MNQATLWTVRKDRKIKGFPQTHENEAGDVVQLVRTLPCHGRGREFESRRPRQLFQALSSLFAKCDVPECAIRASLSENEGP